ncbi:transposase [Methanofollis formosanus]|uniref:transposase n=1 Tax=Methanofollis formosanus TaxID=299308 RepID=UPI001FE585CC|nr:transposase [Methanofollis formosanus]
MAADHVRSHHNDLLLRTGLLSRQRRDRAYDPRRPKKVSFPPVPLHGAISRRIVEVWSVKVGETPGRDVLLPPLLREGVQDPRGHGVFDFHGVDVGQNFLAVASTTDKKCRFFCGGKAKDLRNIYSTMRKRLQSKGTRSAKRMLKHLSGRERRLMTDMNHRVSKEIVEFAVQNNVDVIGLEDLSGIRDRTETSKKQRYTHHSWAFFELQSFIEYKAGEKGISTVYVDPAYTSQTCPQCNHISKNNRHRKSFVCECCGHSLHADLIGARNIESRARTYRYTLEVQGCSQPPKRELSTG